MMNEQLQLEAAIKASLKEQELHQQEQQLKATVKDVQEEAKVEEPAELVTSVEHHEDNFGQSAFDDEF